MPDLESLGIGVVDRIPRASQGGGPAWEPHRMKLVLVFVLVILNVFDLLWLSNTSCWISQVGIFVETFRFVVLSAVDFGD